MPLAFKSFQVEEQLFIQLELQSDPQTQVSGFVKNGRVDLQQSLDEVYRRAAAIGCENFECSFERFKALAIGILQGEMHGFYKNARRVDYGPGIKGLDFAVDGLGEFEHITHAEIQNAVGSAIQIEDGLPANIWKQGKNIGKKVAWQKKFWSNTTRTSEIENINPEAYLPKSTNNTLGIVDCFDVPNVEKDTMCSAFRLFS